MNASPSPGLFRRLFTWHSARRLLLALAVLGTLAAAFYVVENIRGRRAWEATRALAAAKGYSLPTTFAELAPPPVPASENAAEAAVLRAIYDPNPAVADAALERWKTPQGQTITPAILESHAASLAELTAALRRPHLRFPVAYEKGYGMTVPHVGALHAASKLLVARAELRIRQNQPDAASEDLVAVFTIAARLADEGLLISQLTSGAIATSGTSALAKGLEAGLWSAPHRARLDTAFARINLVAGFRRALLGEWGASSVYLGMRPDPRELFAGDISPRLPAHRLLPDGWFDQSRALMGRVYIEDLLPAVDLSARRLDVARMKQATDKIMGEGRSFASGRALAALIFPVFTGVATRQAERQTQLDFARIALALAAWRDANGRYPATLADAEGAGELATLREVLSGDAYTYRPAPDGRSYRLYAFGPDGRDDGGAGPAPGEREPKDWVWAGGGAR